MLESTSRKVTIIVASTGSMSGGSRVWAYALSGGVTPSSSMAFRSQTTAYSQ